MYQLSFRYSNPDYKDASAIHQSIPNLDLFVSSSSPHPFEQYGCTSCHSGRGRGTGFVSSVHMPGSPEQKKEWEDKYDWKKNAYTGYNQCFQ